MDMNEKIMEMNEKSELFNSLVARIVEDFKIKTQRDNELFPEDLEVVNIVGKMSNLHLLTVNDFMNLSGFMDNMEVGSYIAEGLECGLDTIISYERDERDNVVYKVYSIEVKSDTELIGYNGQEY